MRKAYSSPKLVEYGDVADLTQGPITGYFCESHQWSYLG